MQFGLKRIPKGIRELIRSSKSSWSISLSRRLSTYPYQSIAFPNYCINYTTRSISTTTMNKHDFAKNQTKKRKKYGLKECESLLIDINCSNSDKREIIDYVINHHIEIRPEIWDKNIYQLYSERQLDHIMSIYSYLSTSNKMANLSPSTLRYFLRCSTETSNFHSLQSIWEYCNSLRWYSEKEYYLTHAFYIRGLFHLHHIEEGLKEYEFYNPYHKVNNTVNTIILQGLVEGGYDEDCLLLFASLLLNVRFTLSHGLVKQQGKSFIDWNILLKEASCGFGIVDTVATYFDKETRKKLFYISSKQSSSFQDIEADEELHLKFHKTSLVGQYITMNKRCYEHAIKAACHMKSIEFADLLYSILVSNHIKPRKNSIFSILSIIGEADWKAASLHAMNTFQRLYHISIPSQELKLFQNYFLLRLHSLAIPYIQDYSKYFGGLFEKNEDSSVIKLDLYSIPENVGFCFFLEALLHTARLTTNDYLWLKGTLSIKLNMKYLRILEFLKKQAFPHIDYDLKGYILRIPLVSIQNWYQKQGQFSNTEVNEILAHYRCDFGLNDGMNKEVFHQIHELECIGHREIRDLTVPYHRSQLEFEEMEEYVKSSPQQVLSEIDLDKLDAKLQEIGL